jgi:hypothetical protein
MQSSRAQNLLRQIEEVVSGMLRQYQPLDDRTETNMSFIVSDSISNRQSAQSTSSIRQLIRAASFNGIKGRGGQVVVSQYGTYGIDVYPFEADSGVVAGGQLYTLTQMCSLSLRNYLYNPKTEELAKPGVYYVVISGTNLIGLTTVVTPDTPVLAKVVIPGIYTSAISDTEIWRSYAGMPADAIEEAEQSAKAFIVSARDPFFETGEGFIADDYFMRTIRDAFTNLQAENITGTLRLSEALSIENAGGTLKATSSNIQFFDATGAVLAEYGREKARVGGIEIYPDRIQSANYAYGYAGAGFIIRQNGYANFNDVEVRGSIIGSTIDIGGDDSTSFHVDIDGNLWSGDGDFVDAPFSVTSEGLVTAYGGRFSTARSGPRVSIFESDAIGFAAYTATGHDAFKIYLADTGGYSAGDVFLGDGGGSSYAHWDDSAGQLIIKGAISASTIDIGGADATSFHVDADGNIWSGAALLSAAPFKVTNAGVMSAVGGSFVSSTTGGRVEIFPNGEGGDVGIRVYDEEVTPRVSFQVDISGTTAGDVTIGDYAHGQGAKWDASDGTFTVLGSIATNSVDVGTTGFLKGGKSSYADATAGFWLGYTAGVTEAHQLNIGDNTQWLKWSGSSLEASGFQISTAGTGARVIFYPSNTIGFVAYDAADAQVFQIVTAGDDTGDVVLGKYDSGAGAKWDQSAAAFLLKGAISASTIDIGGSDATSFHVDIDGNIWAGAAAFANAAFSVTNAGVVSAVGGSFVSSVTGGRVEIFPTGEGGDVGIRVYDEEITPRVSFQVDISGTTAGDVTIGDYAHGQGALWDASDNAFRILGAISASTIDIGGADTTSFHVDINGNIWSGAATLAAPAPFSVTSAGTLSAVGATISGTLQTAASGQRVVIDGSDNSLVFYEAGGETLRIDSNIYSGFSGILGTGVLLRSVSPGGSPTSSMNLSYYDFVLDTEETGLDAVITARSKYAPAYGVINSYYGGTGTAYLYAGVTSASGEVFRVTSAGNLWFNNLVFNRAHDVTVDATSPASGSLTYTIPDAGAAANFVMSEGAATINGIKTFGSFPVTPSSAPTTDYQVANKKYVDDNAGGGTTHDLLSATHSDTAASAVSRGSILYGNSTPKWAELTIGTSGQVLVSNGTDIAWGGVPGAGSDNYVQYRSGGVLAAESDFTYTPSTNTLAVVNINNSILYSEKYDSGTSFSLATTDAGQDNIILVSGLDDVEQWGYGGSIGFGKINTKDRKSAIFGYQTGSDSDQMGLGFAVHPSGTGSAAMEIGAVLDHAGVLRVPYSGLLAVKELSSSPAALSVPSGTSALAQVFVAYDAAADAYTKLLIHADGAHNSTTFTDLSGTAKSLAATAINSTTQIKFGASSIYFSGSTYIYAADSPDWALGSDNFTIDFWARFSALPSASGYVGLVSQHADANNNWWVSVYNNAGTYSLLFKCRSSSSDIITLAGVIPAGWLTTDTWHHYAVVRNGTLFSFFMDGRYLGTGEDNSAVPDIYANLFIGAQNSTTNMFNGYMDAVRISKGIARWNGPFDPPTVSLNVLDQTGAKYTAKSSSEPLYSFSTIQEYTPSSSTEAGWAGRITYDSDNLYVWVGPASVMVAALSSM